MSQQLINEITQEYMKNDIPQFRPGDTVQVYLRIKEGERERIQMFEGLVISRRGGGISEMFTVRKVRRAKLFYIRNLSAKAARIKELR